MENNEKPGFLKYAFLAGFAAASIALAVYYNKEINAGLEKAAQKAEEIKPHCIKAVDEKIRELYEDRIQRLYPGKE
jgi:hypothetical protein